MTLEEALKKISLLEGVTKELDGKLSEANSTISTLEGKVKTYEELGTPEDIETLLSTSEEFKTELDQYRELGTVTDLDEALENMVEFTKNFREKLGESIEQVETALVESKNVIEAYKEYGSLSDIEDLIHTAEDLSGSLKAYESLLTLDEAEAIVESYEDDLKDIQVTKLTESFNISEAFASEMLEKWGTFESAEEALAQVTKSLKKDESSEEEEKADENNGENPDSKEGDETKTDESVVPAKSMRTRLNNLLGL